MGYGGVWGMGAYGVWGPCMDGSMWGAGVATAWTIDGSPDMLVSGGASADLQVYGCMGAWVYGWKGAWVYGWKGAWVHGCMGVWVHRCVWVHGCMGVWVEGCMGVWVEGGMGAWVYGCMGTWVYGCMGAWVRGGMGQLEREVAAGVWCLEACFSGWAPGQLEREVAAGVWYLGACSPDLILRHSLRDTVAVESAGDSSNSEIDSIEAAERGVERSETGGVGVRREGAVGVSGNTGLWREVMELMGGEYALLCKQADGEL
ncbi:unnamed protein product [Closterium sp. Naga37s-1]|nr:unnamed protein product [Closterium sp. Naga37s-1]